MDYFEIAGLVLAIDTKGQYLHPELNDFRLSEDRKKAADVTIRFCLDEELPVYPEKKVLQAKLLTVYEDECRYLISYYESGCVKCYTVEKGSAESVIYLQGTLEKELTEQEKEYLMYSIRDAFFFYLQKNGKIAVHSASIVYQEKVWLFAASSGTGKSTHVSLWQSAGYDIDMFNGDVTVCFEKDGAAYAAGIPWCGTSHIYVNKILPLGGILFLQRSCHDEAGKIGLFESVLRLNARCLTPNWDRELMDRNLEIVQKVAPLVKTGVLYCTPTENAAEVAKKYIDE